MSSPRLIAEVVGGNCKRVRSRLGLTQDQLARYGREQGLRWTAPAVADFESGRASPTLATVLAVTASLQRAADDLSSNVPVTLAELLHASGPIRVNDALVLHGHDAAAWATGAAIPRPPIALGAHLAVTATVAGTARLHSQQAESVGEVLKAAGVTEYRIARRLGISQELLAATSFTLWRSTLGDERDRRAGPDVSPQKRGIVTRELEKELQIALTGGD